MDKFSQKGLIEFEHNPSHIRMDSQCLDTLEHFRHQPRPNVGHPLLRNPNLYLLEITDCGFSEAEDHAGQGVSPDVSSGNAMIVPGSSFRCGFAIESIASY
jgi:hypothetical protein